MLYPYYFKISFPLFFDLKFVCIIYLKTRFGFKWFSTYTTDEFQGYKWSEKCNQQNLLTKWLSHIKLTVIKTH